MTLPTKSDGRRERERELDLACARVREIGQRLFDGRNSPWSVDLARELGITNREMYAWIHRGPPVDYQERLVVVVGRVRDRELVAAARRAARLDILIADIANPLQKPWPPEAGDATEAA